jgi:hypothetical protein
MMSGATPDICRVIPIHHTYRRPLLAAVRTGGDCRRARTRGRNASDARQNARCLPASDQLNSGAISRISAAGPTIAAAHHTARPDQCRAIQRARRPIQPLEPRMRRSTSGGATIGESKDNQRRPLTRYEESTWFGHHLKDEAPAPWIKDGVSFLDREQELKRLKSQKGS